MNSHMVRFRCSDVSEEAENTLANKIQTWTEGHNEVLTMQDTPFKKIGGTSLEPMEYFVMTKRFHPSDNEVSLIAGLEDVVKEYVDWYIIHYHMCNHGENNKDSCSWDIVKEYGNPPEVV